MFQSLLNYGFTPKENPRDIHINTPICTTKAGEDSLQAPSGAELLLWEHAEEKGGLEKRLMGVLKGDLAT